MLSIVQIGKKPKAGTYLWKFTGDDSAFIGSKCLYDAKGLRRVLQPPLQPSSGRAGLQTLTWRPKRDEREDFLK